MRLVGIGVLADLQQGISVKLQPYTEKNSFIPWRLMPGWQWVEYACTSATRHVGISGWQAWVCRYIWNWACRHISSLKLKDMMWPAMLNAPQAKPAYFHPPSLNTANLWQAFANLVGDIVGPLFQHLNNDLVSLVYNAHDSKCVPLQHRWMLNYHQDHCHRRCCFHAGQLPMHCNAWICSAVCNAAHLMHAAQDHCFILHFSSVFCSIKYECTQNSNEELTGELVISRPH